MKPTEILLLVRSPVEGRVKRRLAAGIGKSHAGALYLRFVLDMLSTFKSVGIVPVICHHPPGSIRTVRRLVGPGFDLLAQRGSDHPGRLRFAFEDIFARGADRAIIVASDSPDIPVKYMAEAMAALDRSDSVIGPAKDGGYYLVGFRADTFVPEAFRDIDWSTDRVFSQTAGKIRNAGRSIQVLPVWYDIDNAGDLASLFRRNRSTAFKSSLTMEYLRKHPGLTQGPPGAARDA
jgi:rSAM/selenodomain-associated transferase 1